MATVYQLPKDEADRLMKSIKEINRILKVYDIDFDENALYDLEYLKEDIEKAYPRLIMSGFLDGVGNYTGVNINGGHAIYAFNLVKKAKKEAGDHLEALEIIKNMNIIAIHEDYITFPNKVTSEQMGWLYENKKFFNKKQTECIDEQTRKENKRMMMMIPF